MFRQEYNTDTKKKFKWNRIRRLQRFQRKNRACRMDADTTQHLLLDPPPHVTFNLKSMDENKDEGTDQPMADVSDQNKQEAMDDGSSNLASESEHRWTALSNEFERSKAQHPKLYTNPSNQYGFHVPQYLKMGRSLFQESLANAFPQYRHDILFWLANPKIFNFVKLLVHDAAVVYHSSMELHYWNAMIAAAGSTLAQLSSESRDFMRKNSIHWGYPQTERNIRHRQQEIQKRMNQFTAKLSEQMERQSGIGMTAESMEIIRQASNTMIEGHFRRLYVKLNDKLILLQYDMYDIQLSKSFYGMFPNGEQIAAVRRVWRLKYSSNQRAVVRNKKALEGLPQSHDADEEMDNKFASMLLNACVTPAMRTIVEARLANMEQRKQQIINFVTKQVLSS